MLSADTYIVERTTRLAAAPFILGRHYAKRWPSVSEYFGLYRNGDLVGVCTFGTPPSAPLRSGVCGKQYAASVIELNRLCLRDNRKNEASRLVSGALKMLGDAVVVSFADTSQNHTGYVYQACNFIYCGLSAKRTNWTIKGLEHLHGQTVADEFRGKPNRAALMREKYGDAFYLAPRPRKHRYVIFTGNRRFKRAAREALKYPEQDYPKQPMEAAE